LPDVSSPKIIPRLVTVEEVAPKLNLLGSLGSFIKISLEVLWLKLEFIQLDFKKIKNRENF
jgi:hypothetical protein